MPRSARKAPGGVVFHVLNRGVGRRTLFHKDEDFAAFERILEQALSIVPVRLLSYCLMPNHWHLILWPRADGDLGRFMQRLTTAHVRRWQAHYQITKGTPFGEPAWRERMVEDLGLHASLRDPGRPKKPRATSPAKL